MTTGLCRSLLNTAANGLSQASAQGVDSDIIEQTNNLNIFSHFRIYLKVGWNETRDKIVWSGMDVVNLPVVWSLKFFFVSNFIQSSNVRELDLLAARLQTNRPNRAAARLNKILEACFWNLVKHTTDRKSTLSLCCLNFFLMQPA